MISKKFQTKLFLAAFCTIGIQVAANAELFPPNGYDKCFVKEKAFQIIHDTGATTQQWVYPVLDDNGEIITSIKVNEAEQTQLPACISQNTAETVLAGQDSLGQPDDFGA